MIGKDIAIAEGIGRFLSWIHEVLYIFKGDFIIYDIRIK